MAHTSSPKRVTFDYDLVYISYISTSNIILNGVANHALREYAFSHFLPYSDTGPTKAKEGKISVSFPFEDDGMFSNVSYLEDEDKYQHDLDIKIEPQ